MKECHNTITKVIDQLSGEEVLKYTRVEKVIDPIYKGNEIILTFLKAKCKVCGDEYEFLVESVHLPSANEKLWNDPIEEQREEDKVIKTFTKEESRTIDERSERLYGRLTNRREWIE